MTEKVILNVTDADLVVDSEGARLHILTQFKALLVAIRTMAYDEAEEREFALQNSVVLFIPVSFPVSSHFHEIYINGPVCRCFGKFSSLSVLKIFWSSLV